MSKDLVCGGIALVVAVVYFLLAAAMPRSLLADSVGAAGMPKGYAVVLGVLSVILIGQSLLRRDRSVGRPADLAARRALIMKLARAGGMLAIGIVYLIVVPYLGYVLSLALLVAGTAYYQGAAVTRRMAIAAVIGAVGYWLLFVKLLGIPLPAGIWPTLF